MPGTSGSGMYRFNAVPPARDMPSKIAPSDLLHARSAHDPDETEEGWTELVTQLRLYMKAVRRALRPWIFWLTLAATLAALAENLLSIVKDLLSK